MLEKLLGLALVAFGGYGIYISNDIGLFGLGAVVIGLVIMIFEMLS